MDAFVQALVDMAEEAGNETQLVTLRDAARAKVLAGGGEVAVITSGTINGKAVTQEIRRDAAELFTASAEALRFYRNQSVSVSYADFSHLTR